MALETLNGIFQLDGYYVIRAPIHFKVQGVDDPKWISLDTAHCLVVDDASNTVALRFQNGPIKEAGRNGVQVDQLLGLARTMLTGLNHRFPSDYNVAALASIDVALTALNQRRLDREQRGVEGTSQP